MSDYAKNIEPINRLVEVSVLKEHEDTIKEIIEIPVSLLDGWLSSELKMLEHTTIYTFVYKLYRLMEYQGEIHLTYKLIGVRQT